MVFASVAMCLTAQTQTLTHEVKAGETLYSLSIRYGVTITDIQQANPGMTESIMAGQKINIPVPATQNGQHTNIVVLPSEANTDNTPADDTRCKLTHEVQKKETLYSIAQDHGLTVEELTAANPELKNGKVKKGDTICIPYTQAELAAMQEETQEEEVTMKDPTPVTVAIIMPFGLSQEKKGRESLTMIDFYEGILLAISELKRDGLICKVIAYDEEQIDSVLALPQLKTANLIIGAKEQANINKLKRFSEQHNISLVVPLSSAANLVNETTNVYQVNNKVDRNIYARTFGSFINIHNDANYIFVNIEEQTDKADYIVAMKDKLNSENMDYHNIQFATINDTIMSLLDHDRENIIITSSSNKTAFDRMVKRLNELDTDGYEVNMLGYPDWQAFADKVSEAFCRYGCMFFTSFYNNPNSQETMLFNTKFRAAFGRDQYNSYPRYGMLGYDIANFFIMNMYVEGEDFAANIENLEATALQNPLHFTYKNSWSGFVNTAMMFVKYNADGTISVKQL